MGVAPEANNQTKCDGKHDALDHGAAAHGSDDVRAEERQQRVLEGHRGRLRFISGVLHESGVLQTGTRLQHKRQAQANSCSDKR